MYGFHFDAAFYASGDSLPKWTDAVPNVTAVSPEYFATIGLRLAQGRGLTTSDVQNGGVTIVNRTLARSTWPKGQAIGQCLRVGKPTAPCLTVIGVVDDARRASVLEQPVRQIYVPATRTGDDVPGYVIVRVAPKQAASVELVARKEVATIFPGAEAGVINMAAILAPQYRPWELGATLFSVLGILALVVAAIGIFSTLAHEVSQRQHELGVRRRSARASPTSFVSLLARVCESRSSASSSASDSRSRELASLHRSCMALRHATPVCLRS